MKSAGSIEDVIVIGGGLAGASAACRLASAGRTPLLIERDAEPRHKVCGEFLSIEAQAYLAHLGIDLDSLGASRMTSLRLYQGNLSADADLPFVARGLSRRILDEALLREAQARGARLLPGVSVRSLTADGHLVRADAGAYGEIAARTLFLATGKHDIRGAKRPPAGAADDMIGFKMHYSLAERQRSALDGAIEVVLFSGGYAGLQLIENGAANLCLVVTRRCFEAVGKSWDALIDHIGSQCRHVGNRLDGAAPLLERPLSIFQIPYGFIHSPDEAEPQGLFRIGDQAAVIPSFTGEGMSIALHGGCLAAATYLSEGRASSLFHRQIRQDLAPQIRLASVLYALSRQSASRSALVRLCRAWPQALRYIATFTRIQEAAVQRALFAP